MENLLFACIGGLIVIGLIWLKSAFVSFRAQRPEHYAGTTPIFDLRRHLNGTMDCEGVIYGPLGRVTSRFVAEFHAEWDGPVGRMTEHFEYDTGMIQDREWRLELDGEGRIKATAPDVVGEGQGWQDGSAVQLRYKIKLPDHAGGHVLDTIDWMYLMANGTIINRSQFRKFGLPVGELVATMRARTEADQQQMAAE